jgi:hypothetical protein
MVHLPPAHHKTSKRHSPNEMKIEVKQMKCPEFEFKPRQVNDLSQSNQGTDHLNSQRGDVWAVSTPYKLLICINIAIIIG